MSARDSRDALPGITSVYMYIAPAMGGDIHMSAMLDEVTTVGVAVFLSALMASDIILVFVRFASGPMSYALLGCSTQGWKIKRTAGTIQP